MSSESPKTSHQIIGLIGLAVILFFLWSLFDNSLKTVDKRLSHKKFIEEYGGEINTYKAMLSIQSDVDALCLSDGPHARDISVSDTAYSAAQKGYMICFEHVFFRHSFRLPFFDEGPRNLSSIKKRTQIFQQKLAAYSQKFKKLEDAQRLLSGPVGDIQTSETNSSGVNDDDQSSSLSDLEIYRIMRQMQIKMQTSCDEQKEFTQPGKLRPKMDPVKEKIWDEHCYESALYYHQSMLPFSWWKGINQLDVQVHFFRARLDAYATRFQ